MQISAKIQPDRTLLAGSAMGEGSRRVADHRISGACEAPAGVILAMDYMID